MLKSYGLHSVGPCVCVRSAAADCVCVLLPIETVAWEPFEADEKPDERSPGSFLASLTSAPSNFSPAPL